jgi:hypothetical protein
MMMQLQQLHNLFGDGVREIVAQVGSNAKVFFFHVININFVVVIFLGLVVVVTQVSKTRTMFFIFLVVGVFYSLACAHILCLVLDGFPHVVGVVGWR